MHGFDDFCRRSLDEIKGQGRYRSFTALEKQADRFPYYRRPDGREVSVRPANDRPARDAWVD